MVRGIDFWVRASQKGFAGSGSTVRIGGESCGPRPIEISLPAWPRPPIAYAANQPEQQGTEISPVLREYVPIQSVWRQLTMIDGHTYTRMRARASQSRPRPSGAGGCEAQLGQPAQPGAYITRARMGPRILVRCTLFLVFTLVCRPLHFVCCQFCSPLAASSLIVSVHPPSPL